MTAKQLPKGWFMHRVRPTEWISPKAVRRRTTMLTKSTIDSLTAKDPRFSLGARALEKAKVSGTVDGRCKMNPNASQFNRYENQKALWTDCRFLLADVPLDRTRGRRMLPLGMGLAQNARATLFVVDYRKPNFTAPYKETGLMIHVRSQSHHALPLKVV
jgi:hypothetical protein